MQELPSDKGLASFELIGGEIITDIFSNSDIEVQAAVKDLALIDLQVENQGRNTGYGRKCVTDFVISYTVCGS